MDSMIYNPINFQGDRSTSISDTNEPIKNYYSIDNYRNKLDRLYNSLEGIKPDDDISDSLIQDDYLEQDVEMDIDKNKFKQIWTDYRLMYNEKNSVQNILKDEETKEELAEGRSYVLDNFDQLFDSFISSTEVLNKYLDDLKEERNEYYDKQELLALSKKELEQEKELFNLEKDEFAEYKKKTEEKLNNDMLKFQNVVEEINLKIEDILN